MLEISAGIGLVVLGLGILLWRALSPPPRVEVGRRGIRDHRLGWGWIPWHAVEGVYPPTAEDTRSLRLRLRPTHRLERAIRRRPREATRPREGIVEVRIDLGGTGVNPLELVHEILQQDLGSTNPAESPGKQAAGGKNPA